MHAPPEHTPEQLQGLSELIANEGLEDFPLDALLSDMLAEIPLDAGQAANANNGPHAAAQTAQDQGDLQDNRLVYPQSGQMTMPQIHGSLIVEQNETTRQNQANFSANQALPTAPVQEAETTNEADTFDPSLFMDPAVPDAPHLNHPFFSDLGSDYWKRFDFDYMTMPGEEEFQAPGQRYDFTQQPLLVDPQAFGIDLTPEQLGIQVAQPPAPEFDFEQFCDQLVQTPAPQHTVQNGQFFPVDNATVPDQGYYPTGGPMQSQNPVLHQPFAFNGGYMPQNALQNQAFNFDMPLVPQPTVQNQPFTFGMPESTVANQSFDNAAMPTQQLGTPQQQLPAAQTQQQTIPPEMPVAPVPQAAQNRPMTYCLCASSTPTDPLDVGFAAYRWCRAAIYDAQAGAGNERESLRLTRLSWMREDKHATETYAAYGQSQIEIYARQGKTCEFANQQPFGTPKCTCGAFRNNMQAAALATVAGPSYAPHVSLPSSGSVPQPPALGQQNYHVGYATVHITGPQDPQGLIDAASSRPVSIPTYADSKQQTDAVGSAESTSSAPTVEASSPSSSVMYNALSDFLKRKRDEEPADALLAIAGNGQPATKRRVTPPRASKKKTSYVEPDEDDIYAPENEAADPDGKSKKKVRFALPDDDEDAEATAGAEVDEGTIVVAQRCSRL
ncbi:hypothetical protein BDY17DRAFT_352192 [Neohortaea acidophila]|uniref:Uncharacterized protein n=1 Tax=Neohortaea acidophila TaxID=245834 RepID=A0A6A6Q0J3_9PEZI|nr:uncharacterized protein BDY17DRAFT_352192 [Neohortaea acidophila]KAF2485506.1 hypothetical protein BDY17DRAFT_352192 [Neohortaea acidophila]